MNAAPTAPYSERASGLLVPTGLEAERETPISETLDADGRRRVGLTADESRLLYRAAAMLEEKGLRLILGCQTEDLKVKRHGRIVILKAKRGACGEVLKNERAGTNDPGAGCKCSALHVIG